MPYVGINSYYSIRTRYYYRSDSSMLLLISLLPGVAVVLNFKSIVLFSLVRLNLMTLIDDADASLNAQKL